MYLALLALTFLVSLGISILIPKYEEYLQVSDITIRLVDLLCLTYRMYFLINCKAIKLCKISDALRTKAYSYFPWPDTKVLCKRQHPLLFVFSSMDRINTPTRKGCWGVILVRRISPRISPRGSPTLHYIFPFLTPDYAYITFFQCIHFRTKNKRIYDFNFRCIMKWF